MLQDSESVSQDPRPLLMRERVIQVFYQIWTSIVGADLLAYLSDKLRVA